MTNSEDSNSPNTNLSHMNSIKLNNTENLTSTTTTNNPSLVPTQTSSTVHNGRNSPPIIQPTSRKKSLSNGTTVEREDKENVSGSLSSSTCSSISSSSSSAGIGQGQPAPPPISSPDYLNNLPFPLICAERKIFESSTTDGLLVLTNYRLWIQQGKDSLSSKFNLPIGLVDSVELRDIFYLHVYTKNGRYVRITFPNNESVSETIRQINSFVNPPKPIPLTQSFAFTFKRSVDSHLSEELKLQLGWDLPEFQSPEQRFYSEVSRMGFNIQNPWRIEENSDYKLCSSYPKYLIVPNSIDRKKLEQVACFRSARRFPAVVWRHQRNGAVICRCSQPEVGLFGWRSSEDEELVQNIIQAVAYQAYERHPQLASSQTLTVHMDSFPSLPGNGAIGGPMLLSSSSTRSTALVGNVPITNGQPQPPAPGTSIELVPEFTNVKKLLILDARSYTTAVVNRARGGGCECLEYYPNCEIQFMNLANIHSIRKSFINLRTLCSLPLDQTNWYSQLEGTKWLGHMSGLMKAALTVVTAVESDGRPVMVHCSDGWDRTPQIVSLAEILLDPYYRSLEGFQVLVEREWLDFGHKFGDRCGQGSGSDDGNERCPVFVQWLDCLHQLVQQFESAFEFNMSFLVKLVQHTYSNLFGTFLCNTAKEREENNVFGETISVWRLLRAPKNTKEFRNSLYKSCDTVLWPSCEVRDLVLWSQVYLGYENPHHPSLGMLLGESGLGGLGLGLGNGEPSQESSPAPSVIDESTTSSSRGKQLPNNPPHSSSSNTQLLSSSSKTRSSSCEDLTTLHHHPQIHLKPGSGGGSGSSGLQRKLSDSSLYAHESSVHLLDNQNLMIATDQTSDSVSPSPSPPLPNSNLESQYLNPPFPSHGSGGGGDMSLNRDSEPEDEQPSDSTVVLRRTHHHHHHPHSHHHHAQSIESSTDTLIAEAMGNCTSSNSTTGPLVFETESNRPPPTPAPVPVDLSDLTLGPDCNSTNGLPSHFHNHLHHLNNETEPIQIPNGMENYWRGNYMDGVGVDDGTPAPGPPDPCSICEKGRNLMRKLNSTNSSSSQSKSNSNSSGHLTPQHPQRVTTTTNSQNSCQNLDKDSCSGSQLCHSGSSASTASSTTMGGAGGGRDRYSMDVDGLTHYHDETQFRVNSIVEELKTQIDSLQKEVQEYRVAFFEQVSHKCHHNCLLVDRMVDDAISISGSEQHSVLSASSDTSSFEHVEEKDVYPPLWVPDFAVTSCNGCYLKFSLGRRKHHCRACGRVFCSDCSENFISIPQEQIFIPSRVCKGCFIKYCPTTTNPTTLPSNGENSTYSVSGHSSSSSESLILITKEQYAQLSETLHNHNIHPGSHSKNIPLTHTVKQKQNSDDGRHHFSSTNKSTTSNHNLHAQPTSKPNFE